MTIRPLLLAAVVATTVFFAGYDVSLAAIGARASISNNEVTTVKAGVETTSSTKVNSYNVDFQKQLTNTISLNGDLRWINTLVNKDGVETETRSSYPVFTLSYSPPAQYNLRLGYNRTESSPSQGDRITTSNMNAGFALPASRLPSLNLSYNKSTTEDHATVQQVNTVNTTIRGATSYDFKYRGADASVNYSYSLTTIKDNVGETTSLTPSHLFSTGLSRDFLDGKLKTSMNYGFDLRETTTESIGSASRFEQIVGAASGLEFGYPVGGPNPLTMTGEPQLIDNDRSSPVVPSSVGDPSIDLSVSNWNMGLGFSSIQAIHELNLYVTTSLSSIIVSGYNFGWQVYSSNNNVTWTLLAGATSTYNSVFSRFEFSFGEVSARYFKVVNTLSPPVLGDIEVTEITALGYALATPKNSFKTTTTRNFTGLTLAYMPTKRLNLGMSVYLDTTNRGSDGSVDVETKNSLYGLNGSYIIIPRYLNFTSTYASTRTEPSDGEKGETNSYTTTFSTTPLDTVSANISYLVTENLLGGTVQSNQKSINTSAFMAVYTGIDLNLGATAATTDTPLSDTVTDSRSYRWGLKLRPWKPIVIIINSNTSMSDSKQNGVATSSTLKNFDMNISYTPSRTLYMSADFDFEPEPTSIYSVTWTPSRAIQWTFRYNSNDTDNGVATDLSWYPFRPISLQAGYTVTWVDNATNDQTETLFTRATIRF
ncbi:hypothetical protein MNBD_DELTA02-1156 [hydrothermal vent metagenome]|uniref:Uncharacterized protein n=1 Tax=hydrothermal vent metagenome TaxID=652676 RepID=A0A3B0UX26_9ZZZZ